MLCDPSSASAVTTSGPSPAARWRFPAKSITRVRLSGLKDTAFAVEKGSCLLVTDSTAMARVDSASLYNTGRGPCAVVVEICKMSTVEYGASVASNTRKHNMIRVRRLLIRLLVD